MQRPVTRALALVMGCVLGVGASWGGVATLRSGWLQDSGRSTWEPIPPGTVEWIERHAAERDRAIAKEIETLGSHPWAGCYVGWKWSSEAELRLEHQVLSIAPESGFTQFNNTWCGVIDGYAVVGRVRAKAPDALSFEVEASLGSASFARSGATTVWLVEWGDLLFAVPEPNVEGFCASILHGGRWFTAFYRRLRGEAPEEGNEARPAGRPRLPERMRPLVPEHPIECRLVALERRGERPELGSDDPEIRALLRLDRGSDHGLAVGLALAVEGLRPCGRVESVERDSAILSLWHEAGDATGGAALVGRTARTP